MTGKETLEDVAKWEQQIADLSELIRDSGDAPASILAAAVLELVSLRRMAETARKRIERRGRYPEAAKAKARRVYEAK